MPDLLDTKAGGVATAATAHPKSLDSSSLEQLASIAGDELISIQTPTHVSGPEIEQDRIRFKNLLTEAERGLDARSIKPRDRAERLAAARELLASDDFWRHQRRGLAVYIGQTGELGSFALEIAPPKPMVMIGGNFHLRPVFTELGLPKMPILALTKSGVCIYEATPHSISKVDVDLPESMDDVNWFVDRESQLQRHQTRSGSVGQHHGHDPEDDRSEDLNRYLRAIVEAIPTELLRDRDLVVLGDDNLVSRFSQIFDGEVVSPPNSGITSADDEKEVLELAESALDSHRREIDENANEAARAALGRDEAIAALEPALEAAATGRLSHLIVSRRADPVWGHFDESTLTATRLDDREGLAGVDLVDRLAALAWQTGAEIRIVEEPIDGHGFVGITRF